MGLWSRMFRTEQRAVDASQFAIAASDSGIEPVHAGVSVSAESSLHLLVVYSCVRLIANNISALPLDVYRRTPNGAVEVDRKPVWVEFPNTETTRQEFLDRVMESLLVYGNAYVLIASRDSAGFPNDLWVLHPEDVQVERVDSTRKVFRWRPEQREFSHYTSRRPDGEVLHIMSMSHDGVVGMSPIDAARQAIGGGLAMEKYASKFFGNGAQVSGVLEMPPGSMPTDEQLRRLGADFRRRFGSTDNAWRPLVLGNGASWKPITVPNDQAQFIESRKFNRAEIAGVFGVPPHMIGDVERSTSWGTGIEQQSIGFVQQTLLPWLTRVEAGLSQLVPRGQFVKLNVNGLLRGDFKSRMEGYQIMRSMGLADGNEIRALEDMPPRPGLDQIIVPSNHVALSTLLNPPPAPEPSNDQDQDI